MRCPTFCPRCESGAPETPPALCGECVRAVEAQRTRPDAWLRLLGAQDAIREECEEAAIR